MAEAALICAMEDARWSSTASRTSSPASARGCCARSSSAPSARVLAAPDRTAALALGDRTVLLVDAPPPTFAERRQAWADLTGSPETGDVAAKFRLSIGQIVEAAEVARLAARRAARDVPSRTTSTSAPARRPRRGSASWRRDCRPATAGTTS